MRSGVHDLAGHRAVYPEEAIDGGIWPAPPEGRATVQLFVEVDDFDTCIARARELGGTVLMAPQKLPDGDEMALITDSEGLTVGLFRPRGAKKR